MFKKNKFLPVALLSVMILSALTACAKPTPEVIVVEVTREVVVTCTVRKEIEPTLEAIPVETPSTPLPTHTPTPVPTLAPAPTTASAPTPTPVSPEAQDQAESLNGGAMKCMVEGDNSCALRLLEQAVEIDPGNAGIWNNLGIIQMDLDMDEEALSSYDKAIAADPQYAAAWSGRGNVLSHFGRYAEAIESFDRALVIEPGDVFYFDNRSTALQSGPGRTGSHP